ncbi:MAG: LysR family transcriptional regulator, regulator for metE and metH [Acidobacteriota bacterium]|jgi:LysR family transcriptional regulator for metE and metH|nr:LysR family transcriptional regulator, regulator for metE and metH [Acidobacteriota bacterium]
MNLEVRHLRLIEAVAKAGSITKAGNLLYLTQSALSHQLRDAEEKLGVALFVRLNKRMILTPAGERLLSSAQSILDEMKRVEEDIRQIALSREGILRITTECYTCYHWLPSLLKIFNQEFPRIEVQIVVEATIDPLQALLDGKIDLALVSEPPKNSKLVYKPLFQDEMVVVMSNDHPLAARSFIKAEDFAQEHLLIYTTMTDTTLFKKVLGPAGITPRQVSKVQLTEALLEMIRAGVGIGVMARWAVAPHIEAGTLRAVPLTKKGLRRRWMSAMLKNKAAPPYLLEFVRLLSDNSVLVTEKDKKKGKKTSGLQLLSSVDCMSCEVRAAS